MKELRLGETYDDDELIVELDRRMDRKRMRTICCESIEGAGGEWTDIRTYVYSLTYDRKIKEIRIKLNGWEEVLKSNKQYAEYKRRLQEKNLWRQEEEVA